MRRIVFILMLLMVPVCGLAATIHVPGDQPTIQAGIDAAVHGDTVLVADGTYTGPGNCDITFHGKAITVRSENGAESCIIDCEEQGGHGFNFHLGEEQDSVLDGFTIRNGEAWFGGGILCDGSSPTITNCTFSANHAGMYEGAGGGIYCDLSSPTITNCTFSDNDAWLGGGILCYYSSPTITNCTFSGNVADGGGGICCFYSSPTITNCTFSANHAGGMYGGQGGGIYCDLSSPTITNCTFSANHAGGYGGQGGGIACDLSSPTITNCTFSGNVADGGGGIHCWGEGSSQTIINCIVWNNSPDGIHDASGSSIVSYSDVEGGWPGEGNIDADPLFVTGPDGGDYYLSQIATGQTEDSQCVDAGDPESELYRGTTRTDLAQDWGVVDMGYHYPREVEPFVTAGAGPSHDNPALVRIYPAESGSDPLLEFNAYEAPFGVNVTCGNMNLDAMDEILTGPGPGPVVGPNVRGFQLDGTPMPGLNFLAYGTHKYGVNVAAGDIDADGFDEIITGAGPGAVFGPHVRGWNYDGNGSVTAMPDVSYFAYGTPKWGVNVSAGDIDGDGYDEIVTGAGPGAVYGPHVRGWNVDDGPATAMPTVSFLAYSTNKYGVNVTCGDVDGDGIDEIVTGPGPGRMFGAHVRGWNYDGASVAPLAGFSFFAWQPNQALYGANVFAGADLNGDGRAELVVGCGPDPDAGTPVKVYQYEDEQMTEWFSLEAAFSDLSYGTTVAAGRF